MKKLDENIPQKLAIRRILENSGLKLNTQIWLPAKNCFDNLYETIIERAESWPNIILSTGLAKETKAGGTPLTEAEKPQAYQNKEFLLKVLNELEKRCVEYCGSGFGNKDWLRLFSSPLGINHLLVGISVHFDILKYLGDGDSGFFMPITAEAQTGTWPRYLNTSKSEETRKSFSSVHIDRPYIPWKDGLLRKSSDPMVEKALSETFEYFFCSSTQAKVFALAREMGFDWIGFDAQYIGENSDGFESGFRIYDFCGF